MNRVTAVKCREPSVARAEPVAGQADAGQPLCAQGRGPSSLGSMRTGPGGWRLQLGGAAFGLERRPLPPWRWMAGGRGRWGLAGGGSGRVPVVFSGASTVTLFWALVHVHSLVTEL